MDTARQALRDYAREEAAEIVVKNIETGSCRFEPTMRGELAGKTFEALQGVLTVLEEARAENGRQLQRHEVGYGDSTLDRETRVGRTAEYALATKLLNKIEETLR